jgi:hypothetical protein
VGGGKEGRSKALRSRIMRKTSEDENGVEGRGTLMLLTTMRVKFYEVWNNVQKLVMIWAEDIALGGVFGVLYYEKIACTVD